MPELTRSLDGTDRRLFTLVGVAALLGLLSVTVALTWIASEQAPRGTQSDWVAVGALILLVAVSSGLVVNVRVGSTLDGVMWADAAILVGLAVLPVPWVVLATGAGIVLAKTVQRFAPVKLTFAVAKEVTVAMAGGAVLLVFGVSGSLDSPAPLLPLAAAFAVMTTVDTMLAVPVIAAASRTRVRDRLNANLDVQLLAMLVRLVIAAAVVLGLAYQPMLLYALPVLVVAAHLWHERWVRTREEHQAWNRLTEVTGAFTAPELDSVLHQATMGGASLFSADWVEVEVWSLTRLVRGNAHAVVFDGDPAQIPHCHSYVYSVPLKDRETQRDVAVLRLRFRDEVSLSPREHAMLTSFTHALQIAIRTASAYSKLGAATARHAHAAAHDPLTGLANRREFLRRVEHELGHGSPPMQLAVLLLDLRHFKEVNDAFGHLVGDQVLMGLADRLHSLSGPRDVVARFGGDEFVVALLGVEDTEQAENRAERLLAVFDEPVLTEELPVLVEANAGLAMAPEMDEPLPLAASPDQPESEATATGQDGPIPQRATELLRRADVAMYRAKRAGRRLATYRKVADAAERLRLMLAGRLPQAVSQREFELRFQPIVDLVTGEVVAAEALARWRHPTEGELAPDLFLDLLERSRQLAEFTAAVLDDALAAQRIWQGAGHDLAVAVNISPRSLLDESLPGTVLTALRTHRVRPSQLCLELTETLPVSQLELADIVLGRLHDIGVRLALDDFGTGHSSLTALSRVPVHQIKIDRSFVQGLREAVPDHRHEVAASQASAVVRSVVQLGLALDLEVVAEGVESQRQRHLLWQVGCALGQGHLFSRPLPVSDFLTLLREGVGRPGHLAEPLRDTGVVPLPRRPRFSGPGHRGGSG